MILINIMLSAVSDKPMYEQIKDAIRLQILSGVLKNGELLPSVRQLSADLNVSAITTKRAYSDLEHEGLIFTSAGKGTYVKAPDTGLIIQRLKEKKMEEFKEYAKKLRDEGLTEEELAGALKEVFEK